VFGRLPNTAGWQPALPIVIRVRYPILRNNNYGDRFHSLGEMEGNQGKIDKFDPGERRDQAADAVDKKISN